MTALYIILGIIALFCLFLFLRAKVFVTWCNELFVRVGLGPVSYEFALNDFIKKDEKEEKAEVKEKKNKKPKKEKKKKESKGKEKKKVSLKEQLEFFKNILAAVYKHFGKKVRVEKYVLKVSVGTPDAAQTAILYGGISGVMANINELILNYRHKKGARIYSECKPDFLSESMDIYVDIGASVTLWNIVITGIAAGLVWLKYKIKTKKTINEKR
ncbi:MAG: DUF2953 domain-containing protein [Clostridia bacterium]|nr:DUF2953 domain-containing protein [Clostridia bacterium]